MVDRSIAKWAQTSLHDNLVFTFGLRLSFFVYMGSLKRDLTLRGIREVTRANADLSVNSIKGESETKYYDSLV